MAGKTEYRDKYLRKKYGITLEEYNLILAAQRGRCGICGRLPKRGVSLHVDHNHVSTKSVGIRKAIRGLLCFYCNRRILGRIRYAGILENAAKYLRQPPAQTILGGRS